MSTPARPRSKALAAFAAAVVAAVLAYPPSAVPGLGLVMIAPLAWLLDGAPPRRAFLAAWLASGAFALWLCRFVVHALVVEYGVAPFPSWAFLFVVVMGVALVPGCAGAAYAWLAPRSALVAPLVFAAVWTLGEWLRATVAGVPWLLAAHSVARWPLAIQIADAGGQYAVSFALLATGGGLGIALARRSALALAAPAAVAALWLGYGALRLATYDAGDAKQVQIGVVQAAVPQAERFQPGSAQRNVARHEEATRKLAAQGPLDLVVWSETAVDIDLDATPALRASLERLAGEIRVPLVTGAPRTRDGQHSNAVVLFAPGRGLAESYDKQRLVPFSEYDPPLFAWLARLIAPVVEGDPYRPGREATVFRAGPLPFSTPVCFEITYPGLVRRFRAAGAELIVNLSNDAWFGRIGYPDLHFDHAILRAVELRSAVVRGANTGISGVVDATGRVAGRIAAFEEGVLRVPVTAAGPPPLYARTGDAPLVAALIAAASWSAWARAHAGRASAPRRSGSSRRAGARGRARRGASTR
jgi:apolipoprotein N-acyltransferase